ncbi:MAG: Hsp20/alpha crystallin family protein [Nitrososphaerales archaeon]
MDKDETEDLMSEIKRMRNVIRNIFEFPSLEEEFYDIEHKELRPLVQITETSNDVIVSVDLPCVTKENIDLKCTEDTLTIKARMTQCVRLLHYDRREMEFENYRKTIKLPNTVDPTKAEASFKNGVLQVRLPKKFYGKDISIE